MTHIGSGFEGEIDSSLDILVELVETDITKMAPFAIFVKVGIMSTFETVYISCIVRISVLSYYPIT